MNLAEYESEVKRTLNLGESEDRQLMNYALGLGDETGRVLELIKKSEFHGYRLNKEEMRRELGDVLWYLTALGWRYGLSLESIAQANVKKLSERFPNGFYATGRLNEPRQEVHHDP